MTEWFFILIIRRNTDNKVNTLIFDYEIVLGLRISEKLDKSSVLNVS